MRTFDERVVLAAIRLYDKDTSGFDVAAWIADHDNVALTNELGDVALFQQDIPHVANGHYFFHSRGWRAVTSARDFLREAFTDYDFRVIRGLTPVAHLGARWLSRQIGFTEQGVQQTARGPEMLVILTKKEWESMNG